VGECAAFGKFDFDIFLNTGRIEPHARFVAVGFEHELKRGAKVLATFVERVAVRESAGDFFDPADEAILLWLDDGVVALNHGGCILDRALVHSQ